MEAAADTQNQWVSMRTVRNGDHLLREYAVAPTSALRDDLVRTFMPLARALAMRYQSRAEPVDDLVQVASLGLVKAIDGFDPSRGRPFQAYAVPTILGEIRRHFRDHVWTLRLPRGLGEWVMQTDKATDRLTEHLGRYPTAAEIADDLGASVEQVLEAIEAAHARRTGSLDALAFTGEDSVSVLETLGKVDNGYDRVEAQAALESAQLTERERNVLRMRFEDGMPQREIGAQLGVSQMQISRISRGALQKLLRATQGDRSRIRD
jgi:RNA polymerase sigma-B factor